METFRIDHELFRSIPADLMLRYAFVPYRREGPDGRILKIVVSDPRDLPMIDELGVLLATPIKVAVGPKSAIESILKKSESSQRVLEEATESFQLQLLKDDENAEDSLTVERLTSDISPVIRLVDSTIYTAITRRASDIHIETQDDAVHVKYRIDGVLQAAMRPIAKQFHSSIISRIKVMAELDIAEKRVPQDGRFKLRMPGQDDRLPRLDHAQRPRRGRGHPHSRQGVDQRAVHRAAARHPRVPDRRAEAVPQVHRRAVRHGARDRADRQRQDDHPLRGALGDQVGRGQDRHDRGSRRIPADRHHPDSDQREERADLRARPSLDPAARSRQDHGRRDPRQRDGADRHQLGAHRPPRVHHRPRQQRPRRAGAVPQHGRRGVPVRLGAELRAGAAAGPHHLHALQEADPRLRRSCSRSPASTRRSSTRRPSTRVSAASNATGPATRAGWRSANCSTSPTGFAR